ncbi:hypothetical protein BC351_10235 [Paenibacillus ferrarius]|uniref:Uncharacterized protein n=1 Tax=Paenibacillus ferrarius TaxID=1469647 RepID=A0A1V4H8S9_9BACL|nr:hypothetical protein [Paenibacillus ferrarius]OPH47563.1 hypothetical protein BC351_10235 [Paenibacillus ferrarius]
MHNSTSTHFSAFASLQRFFELSQHAEPTQVQKEEAVLVLCKLYGFNDESELHSSGNAEFIAHFIELTKKITKPQQTTLRSN